MPRRARIELVLLAAIWGASFLFMRIAAPAFGPLALMGVRCTIGAALLVALAAWRSDRAEVIAVVRAKPGALLVAGVINSALPFVLFGTAALSLSAGMLSILNATTPIFGALVGYVWCGQPLERRKVAGLALGIVGVAILAWEKVGDGGAGGLPAIATILAATLCYAIGGHFVKRSLDGVDPRLVAAGSQVGAAIALLPAAIATWPEVAPPPAAWHAALALGALCTGLAYLLFFRIVASAGPSAALSVTFVIPVFGVAWGAVLLGETIDAATVVGGAIVIVGTAAATGALGGGMPAREREARARV